MELLQGLIRMGKTLVLVYNNHFRGQAVVNALQMQAGLSGSKVSVPGALVDFYPQLKPIAKPDPQEGTMSLF